MQPVEPYKPNRVAHYFQDGRVEMLFECWAGINLDWAAGYGAPLDFPMHHHGLNLTFREQEKSRSRIGNNETVEQPLARGAVVLTVGEDRSWVENPAAFEGLNICLDPSRLAAYARRNGLLVPDLRPISFEQDPRLHEIGRLIVDEMRASTGSELYRDTLVHLAMAHLIGIYGANGRRAEAGKLGGSRLRAVREHVEANLAECLTLDRLASIAAMSTFHFARSFKVATGITPHRFVVLRRMERAMRLLTETKLPVSSVAFQVGYADPSHFVRAFKRLHGATPSQVRASLN